MAENFEIIATINTEDFNRRMLRQFVKYGVTIFRINSAFLEIEILKDVVNKIRSAVGGSVKILIDLPGYKIRFLYLDKKITLKPNASFELKKEYFNYPDFFDLIDVGSTMRINNGFNVLTVSERKDKSIICTTDSYGTITKGKGIHIDGKSYRPFEHVLSPQDLKIMYAMRECDVDYVGISYVHDINDVRYVETLLNSSKAKCIPKIESKESIRNLQDILKDSEMVILDRGDLSGEIGLESIWGIQKEIIFLSKRLDCKIIVATQVLSSMVRNPLPTIAEIDSLYGLLNAGIDGIQLSEETSVGKHSTKCINYITAAVKHSRQNGKKN